MTKEKKMTKGDIIEAINSVVDDFGEPISDDMPITLWVDSDKHGWGDQIGISYIGGEIAIFATNSLDSANGNKGG